MAVAIVVETVMERRPMREDGVRGIGMPVAKPMTRPSSSSDQYRRSWLAGA
jgi:hypothetical protein